MIGPTMTDWGEWQHQQQNSSCISQNTRLRLGQRGLVWCHRFDVQEACGTESLIHQECPRKQCLWDQERQREKWSWGQIRTRTDSHNCPKWMKMRSTLSSDINHSLDVDCSGKGRDMTLEEEDLCSWADSEGLTAEPIFRQHCQQLGQQILQWRGFWAHASQCPPQWEIPVPAPNP